MLKNSIIVSFFLLAFSSCNLEKPTEFTAEALKEQLQSLNDETIEFKDILEKHKGNKIVIDVWASWCRDCIEGLPKLKELQAKNKNVSFIFLSLDRDIASWKRGINRYGINGDHYFLTSGWDGAMGDFLNLNWIPRYVVVNEAGNIALFKATNADDEDIQAMLDI